VVGQASLFGVQVELTTVHLLGEEVIHQRR
jgi:hypothetical protein